MNVKSKFVVMNVGLLAVLYGLWHMGLFDNMPKLPFYEQILLLILVAYSIPAFICVFKQKFTTAHHLANGAPILALAFTGLSLLLTFGKVDNLAPDTISLVFKALGLCITPNVLGVAILFWIRELSYFCCGVEVDE